MAMADPLYACAAGGQLFRREIVDRDGGRDRVRRGFELSGLVRGDGALLHRLFDVALLRGVHAVADWLHLDGQREGALELRNAGFGLGRGRIIEIDRKSVARRAWIGEEVGAGVGDAVGSTAAARAERRNEEGRATAPVEPGN